MNNRNNFLKQSASRDYSNAFRTPRVGIHLKALFETKTMVYYTMRFMLFVQNAYTPEKNGIFLPKLLQKLANRDDKNSFDTPSVGIHLKALFKTKTMVYNTKRFVLLLQNASGPINLHLHPKQRNFEDLCG